MTKEQFNALEVLKQIDYINEQLKNNYSITSVCKELGVGRTTVRERFKKVGYVLDKEVNAYVLQDENNVCKMDVIVKNNNSSTSVKSISNDKEKGVTEVIEKSSDEIKNNLLDLANNYELLKEIMDTHRRNTSVVKQQIIIDIEEAESKLTTLRVNSKVLDDFNNFCNNNKQFKKVDLLSQAIKNFINQYS